MIVLDVETIWLRSGDEVLQIGMIDGLGQVLMNQYLRPAEFRNKTWPEAQRIHGISPAMVKDCPTLVDVVPRITELVAGQQVVIYNAAFDTRFLPSEVLVVAGPIRCAMLAFAREYGESDEFHGNYRWKRLEFAAAHVGHRWSGKAHDAVADCFATLSVWRWVRARWGGATGDQFEQTS